MKRRLVTTVMYFNRRMMKIPWIDYVINEKVLRKIETKMKLIPRI